MTYFLYFFIVVFSFLGAYRSYRSYGSYRAYGAYRSYRAYRAYRAYRPYPFYLPLNLSCLYHEHYALGEAVGAIAVIFLGEAGAEEGGKGLVEASTNGAEEGLYELV